MQLTKAQKIVGGSLAAFIIVLALNWGQFMEGYREGVGPSPQSVTAEGANTQNLSIKPTQKAPGNLKVNLQEYRGQYFSASKPAGWQILETNSGIDIIDPSMGESMGASCAVLVGAFGQSDPIQFSDGLLRQTGSQIQKVVHHQTLPSIPGPMGTEWQQSKREYIVYKNGQSLHALISVAICNGWGQYSVIVTQAFSPESLWSDWGQTLHYIGESIRITNPRSVGGASGRMLPKNNPLDSSSIMSSWEYKQGVDERVSQNWQEAMMGYERGQSDNTGQFYDMPLNSYDPTVGGYRNPNDPTEVLNTEYDAQ